MNPDKSKNKILLVGSIAFDIIFNLTSAISDQVNLVNGNIGRLNLMFTAKSKAQFQGGTAGNISYGLSLLGESPFIFSVAGKDFHSEYENNLKKRGVKVRVKTFDNLWTAIFYNMTDSKGEQIGVWQPNAYGEYIDRVSLFSTLTKLELRGVTYANFAGTPKNTLKHMKELRKVNSSAKILFDPGQNLAALYNKADFNSALKLADFFIVNDTELQYVKKYFSFDIGYVLKSGKIVIETRGHEGSIIHRQEGGEKIPAFKPKKIVDATGAGDAYRAGLLYGLSNDFSLSKSATLGARLATACIEKRGAQNYSISKRLLTKQ